MTNASRIVTLQQSVRESRLGITREYSGLMDDLDVQKRFQNSFKHHPLRWISGAAIAGILTTLLRDKKSSQRKQSRDLPSTTGVSRLNPGWVAGGIELGRLIFPILQPLVSEWIASMTKSALSKKAKHF